MTPEGVSIRDLNPGDLAWVAEREKEIFGPSAWSARVIAEDYAFGSKRYRGIEADGALAGYAIYGFDGDSFHLMNLAIVPDARGRGLGRALMDDFLAEARRLGVDEACLEVAVTNEAALGLYRAYGFDDVRIRPRYYQPEDVDGVVMRLRLDTGAAGNGA